MCEPYIKGLKRWDEGRWGIGNNPQYGGGSSGGSSSSSSSSGSSSSPKPYTLNPKP